MLGSIMRSNTWEVSTGSEDVESIKAIAENLERSLGRKCSSTAALFMLGSIILRKDLQGSSSKILGRS